MARHTRRLILWIIGSLVALALLLALAAVVFTYSVDPNIFRGRIEAAASEALGRRVRLTGDLRWRLGVRLAIESRGGEVANAPGFDGPLATWRTLRLEVAAQPLLHRELRIDHVQIDGLGLRLARDAAGQGNWILSAHTDAGTDSQIRLRIGSLTLRDALVQFNDGTTARTWELRQMNLQIDLPPDWRASPLHFAGVSLRATASGAPLAATGVPFELTMPALSAAPDLGQVSIPDWKLKWGEADAAGTVQAQGGSSPSAQGDFRMQTRSLRGLLGTVTIDLPPTRDAKVFGAIDLQTRWSYHDGGAALQALDVTLDGTRIQGGATLPHLSPLALRFDLAADHLDVDRYFEPEGTKSKPFELSLPMLKALDVQGVLRIREAQVAGATARQLTIDVE
jgi:AsmA protein